MALYQRTYATTCPGALIEEINTNVILGNSGAGTVCWQILNLGNGDVIFEFASALSAPQETELDSLLSTFTCPIVPPPDDGKYVVDDTLPADGDVVWTSAKLTEELAASHRYIVIATPATLEAGKKYYLNSAGAYVLPDTAGLIVGDAIWVAASTAFSPSVQSTGGQLVETRLGNDTEIVMNTPDEVVFIYNGTNWAIE